jgi:hypothetical protein
MAVDTKKIIGRRELRFNSLDEVVADAERLVAAPNTKTIGNWPLDRLIGHLTSSVNGSIDGFPAKAPWFIRLASPLLKRRFPHEDNAAWLQIAQGSRGQFLSRRGFSAGSFAKSKDSGGPIEDGKNDRRPSGLRENEPRRLDATPPAPRGVASQFRDSNALVRESVAEFRHAAVNCVRVTSNSRG